MNSLFSFFRPKDKKFQSLFEQDIKNLVNLSQSLMFALNEDDEDKRSVHFLEIQRLEKTGDEITHIIFLELCKNFITPFDREDIHTLVTAIDDVADNIYTTALNIELYKITTFGDELVQLANLLADMCKDLEIAILELRKLRNTKIITDICVKINKGESQADHLCNTAIARLFKTETNAIELIKQKEILQSLEMATDMCDDAANVLESILIKNA